MYNTFMLILIFFEIVFYFFDLLSVKDDKTICPGILDKIQLSFWVAAKMFMSLAACTINLIVANSHINTHFKTTSTRTLLIFFRFPSITKSVIKNRSTIAHSLNQIYNKLVYTNNQCLALNLLTNLSCLSCSCSCTGVMLTAIL